MSLYAFSRAGILIRFSDYLVRSAWVSWLCHCQAVNFKLIRGRAIFVATYYLGYAWKSGNASWVRLASFDIVSPWKKIGVQECRKFKVYVQLTTSRQGGCWQGVNLDFRSCPRNEKVHQDLVLAGCKSSFAPMYGVQKSLLDWIMDFFLPPYRDKKSWVKCPPTPAEC